jgi:hypothetical protein
VLLYDLMTFCPNATWLCLLFGLYLCDAEMGPARRGGLVGRPKINRVALSDAAAVVQLNAAAVFFGHNATRLSGIANQRLLFDKRLSADRSFPAVESARK